MNAFGYGRPAVDTEEVFFTSTYRRLVTSMGAMALLGGSAIWIWFGLTMSLVFLLGSAIAIVNFHWLRRSLAAMGARFDRTGRPPSAASVILRFLLRYFLIAAAAYVIFKSTANSLNGLFFGLSLPVGAILIETMYQVFEALRTRTLNPRN